MRFDVGAGVAAMGETVAKTAGAMTLEAQRASLQRESLILADQLAGERESKGRKEQHGYTIATLDKQQGFQAGENDLNRKNSLATAGISAGASMANARLAADTQILVTNANIKARAEEHQKTIDASIQSASRIQIGDDGTAYSVNPITQKVEPFKLGDDVLKFRDPDVAKAQVELIKVKTAQLNDITRTYLPQIKGLEDTIRKMQTDPLTKADKTAQKELAEAQVALKTLQERFDAEKAPIMHELNEMGRSFAAKGKVAVPSGPGGRRPLSDLITIPGAKPPAAMPGGLIDNY